MGFKDLKKKRESQLEKLAKETKAGENSFKNQDDRFWQPTVDNAGNGSATIRFLPPADGEDFPWVKTFSHGFQGPGGWLIENCPTTIGKECPVCKDNGELWNSGVEANKDIVRERKRKLTHVSNIMVLKDPGNPDNEGKVFLFRYGKKIFDKINDLMNPEFDDETAVNPFDFWEGADFKMRIRKVDGYRNYDKSSFDSPSALSDDDSELEEIYNKLNPLTGEFLKEDNFKSYADIENRLNRVLNRDGGGSSKNEPKAEDEGEKATSAPRGRSKASKPEPEAKAEDDTPPWNEDDDDDATSFFEKLAKEDDD